MPSSRLTPASTVEVLACDDGSTDGTREILSGLSSRAWGDFMDENVGRGGVIKHLWTLAPAT